MSLEVRAITKKFGGVTALNSCSLGLDQNKICGLIGPNGSGKTTLFNVITGVVRPDSGEVMYNGASLVGLSPRRITNMHIARTFQLTRVFTRMTVQENLLLTASRDNDYAKERISELLQMVELYPLRDELARKLSYGQRKQLEFARILFMDPDLIMLDEPMAGLSEITVEKMITYIRYAHKQGKTIFIIEHNLPVIMNLCEKIFVLANGTTIAEGSPSDIEENKAVKESYTGEG